MDKRVWQLVLESVWSPNRDTVIGSLILVQMRTFLRHLIDGSIDCLINNLFTHIIRQYPYKMPKNLNQVKKYTVAMRKCLIVTQEISTEKLGLISVIFIIKQNIR